MASTILRLTAEEFLRRPDSGQPVELVKGRIAPMNPPLPRHGQVCGKVDRILGSYVDAHDLGHLLINDSAVVTERDPDTVRGADLAFYSYAKVPKGPLPAGYLPVAPDLVIEIHSPGDRRGQIFGKVAEYLQIGVTTVCVLDISREVVEVFREEGTVETLGTDDELMLPELLGGFRVRVGQFFE